MVRNQAFHPARPAGWADSDTWSLDCFLAGWLPDELRHLKARKHGLPSSMFEGLPRDGDGNYSDDAFPVAEARWDATLNLMIMGFEAKTRMDEGLYENELGEYPLTRPADMDKTEWKAKKQARFSRLRGAAEARREDIRRGDGAVRQAF